MQSIQPHRTIGDEIVKRYRDEPEMHFADVLGLNLDFRPRCAPVAFHLNVERLCFNLGDDGRALLAAGRVGPLRGIRGGEVMSRDKVDCVRFFYKIDISVRMFVRQHPGLPRGNNRDDFGLAVVFLEKAVDKLSECGASRLCRLVVKCEDVLGPVQLGHRTGVELAVLLVERDERVVERKPLLERLVGDRRAVELDCVAHGKIVKRGAVGLGVCAGAEEHNPVRELLFLQLVGIGEDLLELRLKGGGDLLGRPRRHLVLRRVVVELRRGRAAPAPAARVLLVGVGEVELEDGLERRGLGVDGRGERGQPVGGLLVGKARHRLLADEERTRGVRPALGGNRLALDFLDLVRYGARQFLLRRRIDLFPRPFEVIRAKGALRKHCKSRQQN